MLTARESEQLVDVLALIEAVLGADLVGAYLHGSAALGGLHHDSDLDVLVVSRRRTTRDEKQTLVARLRRISRGPDAPAQPRRVEVTVVVVSEVKPWRYPPRFDFQYGNWLLDAFQRGDLEPWPAANPDVAILLTMALRADHPLVGPPLGGVIDPIPMADLRRAMVDELPSLLADLESDTRNILLTLARIWSTVATGDIRSKDGAADWALARLPEEHQPVLVRARAIYLGDAEERWDGLEPYLRPHAAFVVDLVRRLARPRYALGRPPPQTRG